MSAPLKTQNVIIVAVAALIAFTLALSAIMYESVLNHRHGRWDNTVTITVEPK